MTESMPHQIEPTDGHLPLPTLLSHALVAYTIEFDNEFEHLMPHRTANYGATAGSEYTPWLASLAMWANCMCFVGMEGVTVRELERLARTGTNLDGMRRWGYITITQDATVSRPKHIGPNAVLRPTSAGQKAQAVWRPLFGVIDRRWQERFGSGEINQLRESLWRIASQIDVALPDFLPILGYGLFSKGLHPGQERVLPTRDDRESQTMASGAEASGPQMPLSTLLSRVLLAFAIDFERESDLSLAISANVIRVLDAQGVRVRDLPLLSGVSKEAISMALGYLQQRHHLQVEPEAPESRTKIARLTPKGLVAQSAYRGLLAGIENQWPARFGAHHLDSLRQVLERLVGVPTAQLSPLFRGLDPYPDGWRAAIRKPMTLPHYPMVLHRGGYPDGS